MSSRMLQSFLCLVLLHLVFVIPALATEESSPELTLDQRSAVMHLETFQPLLTPDPVWANLEDDPFGNPEDEPEMYGVQPKSPRKAFFYSLLLPGAGQIYNGSTILKPILFLGLEAAGIYSYLNWHGNGGDLRDQYEAFADTSWFYDSYIDWFEAAHQVEYSGDSLDKFGDRSRYWDKDINQWVNNYSEHLDLEYPNDPNIGVPTKDHAYYENIGKYEQFLFGWMDTEYSTDTTKWDAESERRESYLVMRKEANDEFGKATNALILTIVNHLASAFDAALMARRYNREQDKLSNVSIKMRYVKYEGRPMPKLILSYRY